MYYFRFCSIVTDDGVNDVCDYCVYIYTLADMREIFMLVVL